MSKRNTHSIYKKESSSLKKINSDNKINKIISRKQFLAIKHLCKHLHKRYWILSRFVKAII